MKKYCAKCTPKNHKPARYSIGKCDKCGETTGVAECEYKPDVIVDIESLFGGPRE